MKASNHDEYIDAAPEAVRARLARIRALVHEVVPETTECISYQLPAFRIRRVFFYFGAFKHHIGIYPPVVGDDELAKALEPWAGPKGNLSFRHDQPVPWDRLREVVAHLARHYGP